MVNVWNFMWFAPDHPYGCHMGEPYVTHVAYIWFAHMGFTVVNHMCLPYGTHIGRQYGKRAEFHVVCTRPPIWVSYG